MSFKLAVISLGAVAYTIVMGRDINSYLNKKKQDLGLERHQTIKDIQAVLERLYPHQARALSLNDGVLTITTASAAVASELYLNQQSLLSQLKTDQPISRLSIQIR